ncbi:hypothetical protein [Streptomyces sp. NBC_00525]|uniref:hypothetical protein n=1 Tax=Streptomyces sp. NBC_00525 TaxID=2903660 RepID=UPI002E80DF23|nr:hypothetical protein [Streptomyces sp. NBC_00525]WUC96171.1 hypothetical protein OG710_22325 [Streptomyces sp. NBC_00525]
MSDEGANEPLPRMSKEKAESWAKHWTDSMVKTAHARLDPESARPTASFTDCVGRDNETADDGRFTLRYSVRGTLPRAGHPAAVTAVKDTLKKKGFEIQTFVVNEDEEPANVVDARHPEDRQFVSVGSVGKDLLVFIVNTPCLLPPGVEQQQF